MARKRPVARSRAESPYPAGFEPLLAAINARPDDDTPRLAFADWLDDHGDPARAEFIRLQCRLARVHPYYRSLTIRDPEFSPEVRDAVRRETELLREHRGRWLRGFPEWLGAGCDYRRGLIATLRTTARRFLKDGPRVRALTALEDLRLERTADVADILRSPTLLGLRRLTLPDLDARRVADLADSPVLDTLTELRIGNRNRPPLTPHGPVRSLFRGPRLSNLRRFRVRFQGVGNVVAAAVAANPAIRQLEQVELMNAGLTAAGLAPLARSPAAAGVRVLNIQANLLGDDGVRELVTGGGFRQLTELRLGYNGLTTASARMLAEWDGLRSVRTLHLEGNRLGTEGLRALVESPNAARLDEVHLPTNGVPRRDLAALEVLPALRHFLVVVLGNIAVRREHRSPGTAPPA